MQKICRCFISLRKFAVKIPKTPAPAIYSSSKRFLTTSATNCKYSSNTGVKGIKGRKFKIDNDNDDDDGNNSDNDEDINLEEDK